MSEESTEPTITVRTRFGNFRLALQFGILGLVGFLVLHVTLLSDRHNDSRYVSIEAYQKDRETDERLRLQVESGLRRQLDDQGQQLKEIRDDIKALLRRNP